MARIAHLSDIHLLEPQHMFRSLREKLRLNYLSFFRTLDARLRRVRFLRALRQTLAQKPDHLVITGDLTEDGSDAQFEVLADSLFAAGIRPENMTLVPGNHDAYSDGKAWKRALKGPLRAFADTSTPGSIVEVKGALVVAVSTAIHQPAFTAGGRIDTHQLERLRDISAKHRDDDVAIVVAQHHAPFTKGRCARWLEGLRDYQDPCNIFATTDNLTVLHGHVHRAADRAWPGEKHARVFSAPAVVDDDCPIRIYEVQNRLLRPRREQVTIATRC